MRRKVTAHAPLTRSTMAFVLAGGRGSRLLELTDKRVKPAVYFGAKSRIIDFTLSNALNSGIRHIAVATQYESTNPSSTGHTGEPSRRSSEIGHGAGRV